MATKPEKHKIKLARVRLSYPYLFSPRTNTGDDGKEKKEYAAVFILDKKKHAAEIKAIQEGVKAAAIAKWNKLPPKFKNPLRDGAEQVDDDSGEPKQGYGPGVMFINAKCQNRPQVVKRDPSIPADEEDVYAGCYVNAVVDFYSWEHPKNGKGISANLGAVQFVANGERFGPAPVVATEVFEDLGDDEGGESDDDDLLG